MPKNQNDVWIEEYANALDTFNIAVDRLRVAVDHIRIENISLRGQLKVINKEGLTMQEVKDKYFPNQDWESLRCTKENDEFTLDWLKNDSN